MRTCVNVAEWQLVRNALVTFVVTLSYSVSLSHSHAHTHMHAHACTCVTLCPAGDWTEASWAFAPCISTSKPCHIDGG